ncbi:MAG: tyrosyl-tRNA synthetase [Candidatus Paceibacteria bacterium]|jgi:tyrosyl-tRNA synthetase
MTEEQKLKELDSLFSRGVAEFIDPNGGFRKKLEEKIKGNYKKDIIIKFGVDPTQPDIHLGHAVVLRKLRKLQELGCKVIFLVGDYTTQIGDPTGKSKVRPELEQKEIEANMKTYLDQVVNILLSDPRVFSWIRNSDWFTSVTDIQTKPGMKVNWRDGKMFGVFEGNSFIGKAILFNQTRMQETHLHNKTIHSVSLSHILRTLRKITHGRLIERDMFQDRINSNEELYMHEMMYPVLQGLDSHILAKIYGSCDLEVGGSDQHFNMLMGRHVMRVHDQEEQAVLSFGLLEGLDGKEKMSKSLDNYIGISDEPYNMYGKTMSIPDSLITKYFKLCTFTPEEEISKISKELETNGDPRDIKMNLARQIVEIYHGKEEAEKAEEGWVKTFSQGGVPEDVQDISVEAGEKLIDIFSENNLLPSKTEFRRRFEAGAIKNTETGEVVPEEISESIVVKYGKKDFVKLNLK